MSLKKWMVFTKARKSVKEFEWVNEHPTECQEAFVSKLVKVNKDTLYGKKLELEKVRSVDEYQKRVPIHDYNTIEKYIKLIMNRERDILFHGTPIWWAKTSGTTSEPKLIPVTREMTKYFSDTGSRLLYSFIMENPEKNVDVLSGKLLYLRAPSTTEYINGIPAGYISGITGETQSRFAKRMVVPRKEVSQLADWEEKFYLTILETIAENVTMIVGVTPLLMSMFQRMADDYPEQLIKDLRNEQTKEKVRKALREGEGRLLPQNCWGNLRLFTPSSASIKPYMRRYAELFGDIPTREAYAATEGQLGHEDEEGSGLLLHWDKYLFEFLPFRQTDSARDEYGEGERSRADFPRERLIVSEIKIGNLYELLITTPFGLYSYRIGDVLRLESKDPYRFTIVGRTKITLNAYGEKVCEDHVSTALSAAEALTNTIVYDYSCAVVADGGSRYVLYVEFIKPPKDKLKFIATWDNKLQEIAPAYACFRARDAMLKPPQMVAVDKGTFQKYEERRIRGRNASGHLKPPHIVSGEDLPHELEIPIRTV